MKIDLAIIRGIVNIWDPLDVIIHAPDDEYETFANKCFEEISQFEKGDVKSIYNGLVKLCEIEFGNADDLFATKKCLYAAVLINALLVMPENEKMGNGQVIESERYEKIEKLESGKKDEGV